MNKYPKEIKLACTAFALLIFITFVPNALLRNWIFLVFVVADFYLVAKYLKKKGTRDFVIDSGLIGMVILMVAAIILNKMGF
ncbi:MAG: hypothetical protein KW788_00755 [Candidatus Doudnabacteria bacterium]|nr:hypothetical protein [Candidatus Doudnabacteria bacterium]